MKRKALLDLVLIDLYECEKETLKDADQIRKGMLKAAELMGAEVVAESFHTFSPWGVSGTVTIAESHLAVHTWPEHNFAAITFETCGSDMNHRRAYEYLIQFFRAKRHRIIHQKRAFMDVGRQEMPYKQGIG
ncbi:MAG TPA: adenosylmethionine decarboxylase [Desulfobacteraceae bacterium]|nr:adenosylmethionine decarboxylase [Desulfobacteraceae bacterium]